MWESIDRKHGLIPYSCIYTRLEQFKLQIAMTAKIFKMPIIYTIANLQQISPCLWEYVTWEPQTTAVTKIFVK